MAVQLRHDTMKAVNTRVRRAGHVAPTELAGVTAGDGHVSATLQPGSWHVIVVS